MHPRLETLTGNHPGLDVCRDDLQAAFEMLRDAFAAGNKLLLCGNGGSAADADHISGELLKGFQSPRRLPDADRAALGEELAERLQQSLPAIPLTAFPALSTAYANDVSAEHAYAQLTLGLGRPGDVLWGISTSGNARNVERALRVARARGLRTLGLTGETGGAIRALCDVCVRAPARETFRVQEFHLPMYHALCLMVEDHFFGGAAS